MTPILSTALLRTQSDARLAALAGDGHERAFEAIVDRYRRPLHRYCRRVVPESRAEDAVQQTFLNAWSALAAGTEVEDLRAWLYRIARNAALDAARKAGYDYEELTDSLHPVPGADEDLERRAVIRETLAGVAALPGNQRQALLRTAVEGHSRARIARDLDLTEGAVRQLVHRARTTLRAAATVLTPLPLASWAAAFGGTPGASTAERIGELTAGAGSAGGAGFLLKAGTVMVAAGALAVGPPGTALRDAVRDDGRPGDAEAAPDHGGRGAAPGHGRDDAVGHEHAGAALGRENDRGEALLGAEGEHGGESGDDRRVSTLGGFGSSGVDSSGSGGSGVSGSGSSGSGSSGSGSSGSGSGDSGISGSGSSGSGESTMTTSSEGPGSGDLMTSSSRDGGSGSSGPGSGETATTTTTTTTTTTSSSGPG